MDIKFPDDAKFITDSLENRGYECYAVGGCVRDSLRGEEPHDWDFTTNALPDEIIECFPGVKLVTVGKRFGTVAVIYHGHQYEITTYRIDGDYLDSRHPDDVMFSSSLKDDLSRRDFTVNAMAYHPKAGVIDCFSGMSDLEYGVIRCVGVPEQRFNEDALRILRALRFSSVLGFSIEPNTQNAILSLKDNLSDVANERIISEMDRLLCGDNVDYVLRRFKRVFAVFIPELASTFGFEQNSPHHNRDVYRHIVASVKNIEPDPLLRTTMLFHDIAKPLSQTVDDNGTSHYKNHPVLGAAMTAEVMKRLCYPKLTTETVTTLIRYHDDRLKPDPVMLKRYLGALSEQNMLRLIKVQRADILAQSTYKREEKLKTLAEVEAMLREIIDSGECYNLKMLAVSGRDVIHAGVASGEEIGRILNTLLDMVITGECDNSREELLSAIPKIIEKAAD